MNVCPICLYVNVPTADVCSRCGKFHFVSKAAVAVADPTLDAADARTRPEGSPSALTKPSGVVSVLNAVRDPAAEADGGRVSYTPPPKRDSGSASSGSAGATSRLIVRPRLEVVRGEKLGVALLVLEGRNVIGRTVVDPVDLDLTGQEPAERVWTSRQHACVIFDGKTVILEDLNSLNGTFVNRQRLFPGQQRVLLPNDVVQVGTVQLRLLISADKVEV
jgi:hypothetical protein